MTRSLGETYSQTGRESVRYHIDFPTTHSPLSMYSCVLCVMYLVEGISSCSLKVGFSYLQYCIDIDRPSCDMSHVYDSCD